MGTYGLSGFRELMADSVMHQSSVPLLSLKCDCSEPEIKNSVLVSSFAKGTTKKVGCIKELQLAFGAKIHLLRINTSRHFEASRKLEERMKAFAEQIDLSEVEYHIYYDKDVASGILNFIEDKGIDMIPIGVEPESIAKLFQRHVCSALVSHGYRPVLTFNI